MSSRHFHFSTWSVHNISLSMLLFLVAKGNNFSTRLTIKISNAIKMEPIELFPSQNIHLILPVNLPSLQTINGMPVIFREGLVVTELKGKPPSENEVQAPSSSSDTKMGTESRDFMSLGISIGIGKCFKFGNGGYRAFVRVRDVEPPGALKHLYRHYREALKLKVDISSIESAMAASGAYGSLTMKIYQELDVAHFQSMALYGCEEDYIQMEYNNSTARDRQYSRDQLINLWQGKGNMFQANVNISVVISTTPLNNNTLAIDTLRINQKILKEEIGWDVKIISQNRVPIKCHKSFLIAHSPAFAIMFQGSGQEQILDMTEGGFRALLEYLYYWEVKQAEKSSLICMELFRAGHTYRIDHLVKCMKDILLSKENDWFDVDVIMGLFLLSRKLPEDDDLKLKTHEVMKSKLSFLEARECFNVIFSLNPGAAEQLYQYCNNNG